MKKTLSRYCLLPLIACLSILVTLIAIFYIGVCYQHSWRSYNKNSKTLTVYLQKLNEEQSQKTFQFFTQEKNLAIWTQRSDQSTKGNGIKHTYFDLMGNDRQFSNMTFYGKTVVSFKQIKNLLNQSENSKTIGLDKGSHAELYSLPHPLFTTRIVLDRLDYVFQEKNTLTGIYYINGLKNEKDMKRFLASLSSYTGIPEAKLTQERFGSNTDYGIWPIILFTSIFVNAFLLLVLFLISILDSFNHFGTLIMLGWSKKEIWYRLFKVPLLFSIYSIPIISLVIWLLSTSYQLGYKTFFPIFAGTGIATVLLVIILIIPTIIVHSISALSALHNRMPNRLLMILTLLFYTFISCLLIIVATYLDRPMTDFFNNIHIAKQWKSVENMSVISSFSEGDDSGTFSGTTNTLEKSMYHFYQEIGNHKGVYLAQGNYLGQSYLNAISSNDENIPNRPFWYLTYSYNYLLDEGVKLKQSEIEAIHNGTRLYLIPDTLSKSDISTMEAYLKESVQTESEDVQTKFTKKPTFMFRTYHNDRQFLTWSSNTKKGATCRHPVIFVASPENLYFMESANLFVSGYNGILKIKNQTSLAYVHSVLKKRSDLKDNKIRFTSVKNYINGLQKDLSYTFYLFGSVIVIILISMLTVFWALISIYHSLFKEKLYVKYFLGFSPWRRYKGVMVLIGTFFFGELGISILIGSKLGILLSFIALILQIMMLYFYLFRKEQTNIIRSLKE